MHGEVALIDGDLWVYDIAYSAERKQPDGTKDIAPFEYCKNLIQKRFDKVMKEAQCTSYEGYLTGSGNFREKIAVTQKYKGTRTREKPYHYDNIRMHLEGVLGFKVVHGMEADDILAIRQYYLGDKSTIVSRDKDLRMVRGWHYGYGVGRQKPFGPKYYDTLGEIDLEGRGSKKKLVGGGLKFFYAQLIMGDKTDNIKGVPRGGDVLAYNVLHELHTEEEMFQAVYREFYRVYGEEQGKERMLEDGRLLWMTRYLNDDGSVVMWEFPFEPEEQEEEDKDEDISTVP